jgi:hypothetical protein
MSNARNNPVVLKRWSDSAGTIYVSLHFCSDDVLPFGVMHPNLRQRGSVETEYVTDGLAKELDAAYRQSGAAPGILLSQESFRRRNGVDPR